MKRLKLVYSILFLFSCMVVMGQQTVKGKVVDLNNLALPGATVLEVGTTNGTVTDIDGNYTINLANPKASLSFNFIGFITVIKKVESKNEINVVLEEDVAELGEVVVTALGFEERKDELGYSTSSVSSDVIKGAAETSVLNSLSGKSTGVRISRNSGDPGAGAYIQIRGVSSIDRNSQPLIILDGIPISNDIRGNNNNFAVQSRLNDINPNDIESMSVLKGASAAALWGTQALGGVIYITTKSGKYNQKMKVTFNSTLSIDKINVKYPVQSTFGQGTNGNYDNGSPYSWGDKISDRSGEADVLNTSGGFFIDQNGTTNYPIITKNSRDVYDESNFDRIFQTGHFLENNLSIESGNENSSIRFSIGDFNQEGIIKNSSLRRTTASLSTKNKLSKKVDLSTSFKYTKTNSNAIRRSVSNNGLYLGFLRTPADFDISGYRGDYYPSSDAAAIPNRQRSYRNPIGSSTNAGFNNPLWTINEQENRSSVDRIIASMNLTVKPVNWLDLIARVGIDKFGQRGNEFYTPGAAAGFVGGRMVKEYANNSVFNMDYIAKARKAFSSNFDADILVGFNFNHKERVVEGTTIQNFLIFTDIRDGILDVDNAVPENREADSSFGSERTTATYTAANFSAFNQLFVNATLRAEWASTFGLRSDEAFLFPSTSIAWQFSKLPGLKSDLFSFGKLRASYAEVGVQPARYNTFPEYVTPNYSDQLGGSLNAGLYGLGGFVPSTNLGNPSLKPERKREFEIGTDLRFFKDRLSLGATYYFNRTTDILLSFPIANSRGYDELYSNAASMQNRGVEMELNYNIYKNADWNIDMKLIYFTNKNEVTDLVGLESIALATGLSGVNNRAVVGQQHGILWGPRTLRDDTGDIVFDDNGFPMRDEVEGVIGDPNPDWQGSAVGSISYKNLSLSFLIETFQGADIFAGTKSVLVDYGRWGSTANEVTASQNLLTYGGDVIPAGTTFRGDIQNFGAGPVAVTQDWYNGPGAFFGSGNHELYVEDGSWTRLRELTLSYRLNSEWLKKGGISSIQMSATGRNLFLWTAFEGNDPDTNVSGVSSSRGIDYFNNPSTKSYVFSLTLTF
ncbi:MAG: TonB-linked SusC/RagA family outer membrane protein [Cyclobacteriaceae bacterium]|jgi:TonB-linked SusC/RagA family outer membrane protein